MSINVFFIDKKISSNLTNFFKEIKEFTFSFDKKISDLNNLQNDASILFFSNDKNSKNIQEIEKFAKNKNLNNIIFFIPLNLRQECEKFKLNILYYPISIELFEKKLFDYLNNTLASFKFLTINNQNLLKNTINKKNIFLTEIEAKIIKMLFINNSINKSTVKTQVLKLKLTVESKKI